MTLSREQRRNHDPLEIGINDLLAMLFNRLEGDCDFAAKMQFSKVNIPDPAIRWEMTMGRNGSPDFCGSHSHKFANRRERREFLAEKRRWLQMAIDWKIKEHGQFFSVGEMIKFKDVAQFYPITDDMRPFVQETIVKEGKITDLANFHGTRHRLFYPQYLHAEDTALVVKDQILYKEMISNPDDWAGVVRFQREVELLLTSFRSTNHVVPNDPMDKNADEWKTRRAILLLSPHNVSGPGQQKRLFERMSA